MNCFQGFKKITEKNSYFFAIASFVFFTLVVLTAVHPHLLFSQAHAAEDQFIIRQLVGSDTTAPSIPTGLTATAVSQDQIDLVWNASTDNSLVVAGYQVFRDLAFVATTTSTSYSDTGLVASTLYTYTVTAFDNSENISARSASSSATTFDIPPVDDGDEDVFPGGSVAQTVAPKLLSLSVFPNTTSALIQFRTNVPTQAFVYWGLTTDYEIGSIASPIYLSDRVVQLPNLTPGTRYFFKIEFIEGHGRRLVLDNQEFTTPAQLMTLAPSNVSNFTAKAEGSNIVLTWNNPLSDFEIIRIVRSDKFYPRDPSEGEIIFEGRSERYIDEDVVAGVTYYYSAFTRNIAGFYSSGAVTDGRVPRAGEEAGDPRLFAGILQLPKDRIDPRIRDLVTADFDFFQDNTKLLVENQIVRIRGDRNLLISIDYEKLPEILKTIVVTLRDPSEKNKTFSFLLRINKDKTAYEASIGPLGRSGEFEASFMILDHKHQGLTTFTGTLISQIPDLISGGSSGFFDRINLNPYDGLQLIVLISALSVIIIELLRRKVLLTP